VILAGITIGKGCVVGANSVVTRDLPPYSVAVGAPAAIINTRLRFAPPRSLDAFLEGDLPYFYSGFGVSASERVTGKQHGGLLAQREFSVAVETAGAQEISVTARFVDTPCALKLGKHTRQLQHTFTTMSYPLEATQAAPLSFSAVDAKASSWPVCISRIWVH
jgi:hypothetical protein